ncbi:hypothetical protein RHO14_04265 [Orbus wheelerorum]|uniref:hypothetical protein n=1 Tax=Orbus wheelerorum TaxID=3074111 RepID=UPI00370D1F6F
MYKYKKIILFILLVFSCSAYALLPANQSQSLNEWENVDSPDLSEQNSMLTENILTQLQNLKFKIDDNYFYVDKKRFPISIKEESFDKFVSDNNLPEVFSGSFRAYQEVRNETGKVKNIKYIQFTDDISNNNFSHYLTKNNQLLYIDNIIVIIVGDDFFVYAENYQAEKFKALADKFMSIPLPLNSRQLNEYISSDKVMYHFGSSSKNFRQFLAIPFITDDFTYLGVKLKNNVDTIIPVLIIYYPDSGQEVNLYLFSNQYQVLDQLLLSSYEREAFTDLPAQNSHEDADFVINENNQIDIHYKYYDGKMLFKRYQVTNLEKIEELPVSSSCYAGSLKEGYTDSSKSLLLTKEQVNNYLRFDNNFSSIENMPNTLLSLNIQNQQLCVDYLNSYSFKVNSMNTRDFFNNDELYQQQLTNFKKIGIDITDNIQYLEFSDANIKKLLPWLIQGNKAIYINNKLFLVGEKFFIILNQPTKNDLS